MRTNLNAYTKVIIIISFVMSAGLVLFIVMNANGHLSSMSRNNSELYSAYRISDLMKTFKGNLLSLEGKRKAYMAGNDASLLGELRLRETEIKSYLRKMEEYFAGRPEEQAFYSLEHLTFKKLLETKSLGRRGVKDKGAEADETNTLNQINAVIDEIDGSLGKRTETLIENSVEYVRVSKKWSILEVVLGVIVLFVTLLLLLRDIGIRNKLEAELRIAKQQADDNATLKEQFMANMSHEIRTPMNAILGFTDLMQKTELDKKQAEYTSAIRTSGGNLLNIINDILDFSKIEAGKLVIDKIAFNVPGLIDSLRIMFAEKAIQKEIGFDVVTDPKIPEMVFGDPTRLTQILVNLINNAIKFTDAGHVKLSCEVRGTQRDVARLVFRVKDTGIGIPADKLDTVFERFNQGNKETTRKYGGTGLGLSIVRDLVELQNGEISVKSKYNSGSEFIVTLSYPVSYETHTKTPESAEAGFSPISSGRLSVLLVEDNELNQKLARTYLQGFGLDVELAENGQVAIDKLQKKKFDLILMDMQMPVLDGYHAARKIRQELRLEVPIIAMTAHIMSGEKEKCISYGMNDYISKPFKETDLYEMVARYLKKDNLKEIKTEPVTEDISSGVPGGVVDFKDINNMARGNKAFIQEMIDLFLKKNPEDIQEIETAIRQKEFDAVKAISHRMKTSVGFMGLKHLGTTLDEIETLAENKDNVPGIIVLLEKVKADCAKAKQELQEALTTRYA